MQHGIRHTQCASSITHRAPQAILLIATLLVALFLRVYRLDQVPAGVDYDEAGNFILAGEIASGESRPVFIRAYAGREAVFYWLAAGSMWLLGRDLFAFRLAAALCGVGTVLFTFLLAREMFHDERKLERCWVPLIGAALIAVSYWHVHVSRYGFRVNSMTLLLAATMTFLWRGLRRDNWLELAAAGVLCGLSANTYLAIRAFPLVLGAFAFWVILAWKPEKPPLQLLAMGGEGRSALLEKRKGGWRWMRVRQLALFGAITLLTLLPLVLVFYRNPEYFSTRMDQASVFDPAIHGGDLWGTLGRVTLDALGIFTVRGDDNPVYNYDQRPIYGPPLAVLFYVGLTFCLYRGLFPRRKGIARSRTDDLRMRTPYLLVLVWLPVMLLPNILGARGVPHSLRAMGLIPVVYYLPALGLLAIVEGLLWAYRRARGRAAFLPTWRAESEVSTPPMEGAEGGAFSFSLTFPVLLFLLLTLGAARTYSWYFDRWTQDPEAYYRSAADVRREAEYLSQWDPDEVTLYVSNDTYRHTTIAAFCRNYARLRWFSGDTLVLPGDRERPVLYAWDHTNPLDPVLARYIPEDTLQHRELGPDGKVGFEAYLVPPEQLPHPEPQVPMEVNLGNTVSFLGYDLNGPAVSSDELDVTLYWRSLRDGDRDDWTFFAHLVDDQGFRWGGETFFHYPSAQWQAGDVMLFRQRIPIAAGAPPDAEYGLDVGLFSPSLDARLPVLNESGHMAGTTVHVGPLEVARAEALPSELPPIQEPLEVAFGPGLSLLGFDRDRGDLRPGETLALSLYWQAGPGMPEEAVVSLWLQGKGTRVPLWEGDPVRGRYPFARWQPPEFVRDRYALRLPLDTAAGDWGLRLARLGPGGAPLPTSEGEDSVSLGTIHVHASDRLWEPPAYAHPVGVRLGETVELLGYDLDRQQAAPGDVLHLTLVWQSLGEMDTAYTVFTHLLDGGGQIRGQKDNPPVDGRHPTTTWVPGEVVVDVYDIPIRSDAPLGPHVIEVGMYDPQTLQRLPVLDLTGAVGDRILLGDVQVVANP